MVSSPALKCANLFTRDDTRAKTHTLVIVTRSIDKNLCYNVRMGQRSYGHVCLLSHPSTVPSRPLQLPACPRHGDGALPYMANVSSSLVVEKGFLTVEHSSGQQPLSRVFYAPPGATLWLHRSTPPLGPGVYNHNRYDLEASPSKQVPARHPIVIFPQCVCDVNKAVDLQHVQPAFLHQLLEPQVFHLIWPRPRVDEKDFDAAGSVIKNSFTSIPSSSIIDWSPRPREAPSLIP